MYERRGWTKMYWDVIAQLYWAPQYVGLKSIPQRHWEIDDERVSVPREMTNESGPLYRRLRATPEFWPYIQRQEETFNHIFDLTFSIAPGETIADLFGEFVPMGDGRDFASHGRELGLRFGATWKDNVTTTDGFFTSSDAILAVELKFNAKTSKDQLAKYLMVVAAEQIESGAREHLNLLYVFPSKPEASFTRQTGLTIDDISGDTLPSLTEAMQNKKVLEFFDRNKDTLLSTLDRIQVKCISWTQLTNSLQRYVDRLGETIGEQTLQRLLDGLIDEIQMHPLSGV